MILVPTKRKQPPYTVSLPSIAAIPGTVPDLCENRHGALEGHIIMIEQVTQSQQQERPDDVALALGERIGRDWQAHVEDDIRAKAFQWFSCDGCGLRVKHQGRCHKCA